MRKHSSPIMAPFVLFRSPPVKIIVGSSAVDVPLAVDGSGDIDFNDFVYDRTGTNFSSFSLRFYGG